jgi:hypothetical protein
MADASGSDAAADVVVGQRIARAVGPITAGQQVAV